MTPSNRLESIDAFRGFAILTMVLANYLAGVSWIPAWLKHAPDIGLTVIDLIAPFFIFAIGLTFGLSFRRRQLVHGWRTTAGQFAVRYLAILGIGAILSAGEAVLVSRQAVMDWGVLQAIGISGLLTIPVISLPKTARLAISLVLLIIYEVALDTAWRPLVLASPHGGLPGSLGWTAMLILGTVLADLFHDAHQGRRWFPWAVYLTLLAGIALAFLVPVSKNRVSASYILISTGISGIIFLFFHALSDLRRLHFTWLTAWGENPLLLYILHFILIGIAFLPDIPAWYVQAPAWLVLIQAGALVGILTWIALHLHKKLWFLGI
jgi:predicted acyltransferase